MNRNVIVTCAVTGSGDSVGKHPGVPVTPKLQMQRLNLERQDCVITHIHVREPET